MTSRKTTFALCAAIGWLTAGPAGAAPVEMMHGVHIVQFEGATTYSDWSESTSLSHEFGSAHGQVILARGDLSTGEVGTLVEAAPEPAPYGQTLAHMYDTLSFDLAGGLPAEISFTGTMSGRLAVQDNFSSARAQFRIDIYDITGRSTWLETNDFFGLWTGLQAQRDLPLAATLNLFERISFSDFGSPQTRSVNVSGVASFVAEQGHTYGVVMTSNSFADFGGVSDFYGTGSFRFADLAGATFSSGSGVFLAGVSPVPEPASAALLVLGLAVVARRALSAGPGRLRHRLS